MNPAAKLSQQPQSAAVLAGSQKFTLTRCTKVPVQPVLLLLLIAHGIHSLQPPSVLVLLLLLPLSAHDL